MSGKPPSAVANRDLKPDVTEDAAHKSVAAATVEFIEQIIFGHKSSLDIATSTKVVQPLIDAMVMEGSYQMKPPCYNTELVNA
jgi:hypothetical protein